MKKLNLTFVLASLVLSSFAQREIHVSVNGKDSNKGTLAAPLRSISAAAKLVKPGDVVTVHAGVYRELVAPELGGSSDSKRMTFRAAKGERVELKGSEIVKGWKKQNSGFWRIALHEAFFKGYNPFKDLVFGDWFFSGGNKVHTGEVYLSGHPLFEVAKVEQPNTWSTEAKGDSTVIWANFGSADPNVQEVEINVRPACFYPAKTGVNYITVRGFHMSQAATQWAAPTAEQVGMIGTNWSKGWVIEDNIISDSKCTGITLGKDRASGHNVWFQNMQIDGADHYNEVTKKVLADGWGREKIGSHLVRNNTIFRCGQAGICGSFGAAFSEISSNHIYDIYTYRNFWGAEIAGIKLHAGIDALIYGNRIHNAQKGIWLDWMTQGTRVSSNLLYNNDYVDVFLEVNHGPYLLDNNLLLSGFSLRDLSQGGAFTGNLFAGLISRAPDNRTTPYFKPNGTEYAGLKNISGGDNHFTGNVFIGRMGQSYTPKGYHADSPDSIDSLAGYGLSIYNKAHFPVTANNNLYLNGAFPMAKENGSIVKYDQPFKIELETIGEKVFLKATEKALPQQSDYKLASTESFGKSVIAGQGWTGPDGKSLLIDKDYLDTARPADQNFSGPMEFISGRIQIWPRPEQAHKNNK